MGGPLDVDGVMENSRILWDITNFNDVPRSMLTVFQVLTLEYWTDPLMYQYMSATNKFLGSAFFLFLVILGAFFLMNLFLAQMIFSFDNNDEEDEEEKTRDPAESAAIQKEATTFKEVKIGQHSKNMNKAVVFETKTVQEINTLDGSALIDERDYEFQARKRSHRNPVYRCMFKLVTYWGFNFFITVMIVLNTACLAADTFDQSFEKEFFLETLDLFFTWLFVTEAILKLIGLGPRSYIQDHFNIFDCIVALLSLVDFSITLQTNQSNQNTEILTAFRTLRLLRIIRPLKLARRWKALHEIIGKTSRSVSQILDFVALLGLFMFIFSLLGMQLFGSRAFTDMDGEIVPGDELVERYSTEILQPVTMSFDNIYKSCNSIYRIITGQGGGWSLVMYENLRPVRGEWGLYSLYFVLTRALGT